MNQKKSFIILFFTLFVTSIAAKHCCRSGVVRIYQNHTTQVQRFPYAMSAIVTQIMAS